MTNIDEIKQAIEQRAGVPASLLTGETAEEVIATAKALLAYKKETDAQRPRSMAEQFSDWMNAREGIEQPDTAAQALADIEKAARVEAGGYPMTRDAGEALYTSKADVKEQFAEWLGKKTAFDPFKSEDGWKPMFR